MTCRFLKFFGAMRWKYLMLVPLLILAIGSVGFVSVVKDIDETMLRQKLLDATNHVTMVSKAIEASTEALSAGCVANVVENSIEFLDSLPMMYSAAFKRNGGDLVIASARNNETSFDPRDYESFLRAVLTSQSGNLVIGAAPEGLPYRDLHVYYQWAPAHLPENERYLIVVGVSKYSVVTPVSEWIYIWLMAFLATAFAVTLSGVILVTRLGHIWSARKNSGDVYRNKR